jgi:dihydrolipoamide dehydrogenase
MYDLIVIGAGPAGETAAIRAAQLGLKVALVEKRSDLGGTCLNVGCIPTKALLEAAKIWTKLQHVEKFGFSLENPAFHWDKIQGRKDKIVEDQRKGLRFLMKKNRVEVLKGTAHFLTGTTLEVVEGETRTKIEAKHILIATGSEVRPLPFAPIDGRVIHSSDTILSISHVPKTLAVIGGGVVGMEFASLFGRFGTQVTVIELLDQVLPFEDEACVKELVRHMERSQNVKIQTGVKVESMKAKEKTCAVTVAGQPPQDFDAVLVSIGRRPVLKDLRLETIGVQQQGEFVTVDSHYRTTVPTIFAVGDVIATPALAHTASAEAIHAVEIIAGKSVPLINYEANPSAVYTYPEISSIGKTEKKLKEAGIPYKASQFPFAPLAKAKIEDATEGFIKVLTDPVYGELLGVHIVGARATELISEFALGKVLETTIEEIGHTIHPHPTISETVMEVAHAAMGGAIHM